MATTALKFHTEQVIGTSNYIKTNYLAQQDVDLEDLPLTYDTTDIHGRMKEVNRRKKILASEKVAVANKLLDKSLEANIVEALRENLELLSEISIQLTDLSLMYDYLIHTENMAS